MIDHHYTNSEEIIIIGDLNIDKMRVDKSVCTGLCDVYGLNIIKGPIFLKSKIKGTLIDAIIVSNTMKFCLPFNVTCGASVWHNMVAFLTKSTFPLQKPHKITYRSYKNFKENAFKQDVSTIPSSMREIFDNGDDQYWALNLLYCILMY